VQATIRELGPTFEAARPSLANLDAALPPLRAYVLALEPGVAELPDLFDAATPWLAAANELLEDDALGGLAEELRRGAPVTAEATTAAIPLLDELSKLSRCVSDNLDPTFDTEITVDPNVPAANAQPAYLDFLNSAVNTAGAAANFDGNGHYLRVQTGGGDELTQMVNPDPTGPGNTILFGNTIEPVLGTQPPLPAGQTPPPFEPGEPCQDSEPANLNGPAAAVGGPLPIPAP
jgi:hypothetical protein